MIDNIEIGSASMFPPDGSDTPDQHVAEESHITQDQANVLINGAILHTQGDVIKPPEGPWTIEDVRSCIDSCIESNSLALLVELVIVQSPLDYLPITEWPDDLKIKFATVFVKLAKFNGLTNEWWLTYKGPVEYFNDLCNKIHKGILPL